MTLIYLDKSAMNQYFKDEGLILNLLDKIKANLRQKERIRKYKKKNTEIVQLTF